MSDLMKPDETDHATALLATLAEVQASLGVRDAEIRDALLEVARSAGSLAGTIEQRSDPPLDDLLRVCEGVLDRMSEVGRAIEALANATAGISERVERLVARVQSAEVQLDRIDRSVGGLVDVMAAPQPVVDLAS